MITICCGFIKSARIDIGHGYIDNTGFDLSIMDIKNGDIRSPISGERADAPQNRCPAAKKPMNID